MLAELHIRNFALIERQRVTVGAGAGLCVVSGGTGAGKSLVVDALKLVLGGRASADVVRSGAEECEVEALFYVDTPAERARVAAASAVLQEGLASWEGELVLTRSVSRAGRSRATINGRLVPVGALAELGGCLVEICGQHDTHALFQAEEQREIVDLFARVQPLRERYRQAYEAHRQARERAASLRAAARDRAFRQESLSFQRKEVAALGPKAGELTALEGELKRLESAARIRSALRSGYAGIYESDGAVLAKLRAISREIDPLRGIVPELGRVSEAIAEASRTLEDAALTCRDLRSGFRMDEERREEVDARIGAYRRLSLKLGVEADALPERLAEIERELLSLESADDDASRLEAEAAKLEKQMRSLGAELTKARAASGTRLAAEVERELADLGMPGARLSVEVASDPQGPGPSGLDRVEMRIRTNAGDEAKPLRKIASGGEASRVMLALKARLAGEGSVPTLVFDEIDANVGGRLGTTIGGKLAELARRWQVLCVTHLPQIAAYGERHLHVSKATEGGRTATTVTELSSEERVLEIARMIRGEAVTAATITEAREMLAAAKAPAPASSEAAAAVDPAAVEPIAPVRTGPSRAPEAQTPSRTPPEPPARSARGPKGAAAPPRKVKTP